MTREAIRIVVQISLPGCDRTENVRSERLIFHSMTEFGAIAVIRDALQMYAPTAVTAPHVRGNWRTGKYAARLRTPAHGSIARGELVQSGSHRLNAQIAMRE